MVDVRRRSHFMHRHAMACTSVPVTSYLFILQQHQSLVASLNRFHRRRYMKSFPSSTEDTRRVARFAPVPVATCLGAGHEFDVIA
jgi:hypothetical protein